MIKECYSCGFWNSSTGACRIFNYPLKFCSLHEENPEKCSICGSLMLKDQRIVDLDTGEIICRNCSKILSTCKNCTNSIVCAFDQDPDPMPKIVTKTVQQGNMTMQMQITNEERVKKFCLTCDCYLEDFGCQKTLCQGCEKIKKPTRNS